MRISEIFNLGRTQYDLDFIDIDPSRDTLLYLEPHFLRDTRDEWCRDAVDLIDDYFHKVLKLIEDGHLYAAKKLLSFLGEPTETCLGQSKGEPRGRGLGEGEATKIMDDILQAPAIQAGVIEELEDLRVFVHGIGPHKVSEAVSNIIRGQLIEYTQTQCDLHGIPLTPDLWSNPYWDPPDGWTQIQTDLLTVEHKQILLVPKNVVCRARGLTQGRYYSQGLLEWHKKDHLRRNTRLVVAKRLKSGRMCREVFKRDLKQMVPNEIQVLIDFTDQHPDVFAAFKANMPERFMRPLMPEEVAEASGNTTQAQSGAREVAASGLVQLLDQTPTGKEEAARFQKVTGAILAFALHPHLVHPELEEWINEGRKRVDIVFRNGMPSGSFFEWVVNHGLTCRFVFVECKNYGQDVHNPELDQLIGRFDPNRGKVGIMVCRRIEDWDLYVKRCRDAYRSHGGLILTLQDKDLIELAQRRGSGDPAPGEDLLYRQARDIILEAW